MEAPWQHSLQHPVDYSGVFRMAASLSFSDERWEKIHGSLPCTAARVPGLRRSHTTGFASQPMRFWALQRDHNMQSPFELRPLRWPSSGRPLSTPPVFPGLNRPPALKSRRCSALMNSHSDPRIPYPLQRREAGVYQWFARYASAAVAETHDLHRRLWMPAFLEMMNGSSWALIPWEYTHARVLGI